MHNKDSLIDSNGVVWRKVLGGVALRSFMLGRVVLIAEVRDNKIVNNNWVKALRSTENGWYTPNMMNAVSFGLPCHHVRDRAKANRYVHTYIEEKKK